MCLNSSGMAWSWSWSRNKTYVRRGWKKRGHGHTRSAANAVRPGRARARADRKASNSFAHADPTIHLTRQYRCDHDSVVTGVLQGLPFTTLAASRSIDTCIITPSIVMNVSEPQGFPSGARPQHCSYRFSEDRGPLNLKVALNFNHSQARHACFCHPTGPN